MNCDCVGRVEKNVASHVREKNKFSADLSVDVTCTAISFGFTESNDVVTNIRIPFKVVVPTKGFARGKELPVMASFCPFCGVSTKPAAAKPEGTTS